MVIPYHKAVEKWKKKQNHKELKRKKMEKKEKRNPGASCSIDTLSPSYSEENSDSSGSKILSFLSNAQRHLVTQDGTHILDVNADSVIPLQGTGDDNHWRHQINPGSECIVAQ